MTDSAAQRRHRAYYKTRTHPIWGCPTALDIVRGYVEGVERDRFVAIAGNWQNMETHLEAATKARAKKALEQGKMEGMEDLGTRNAPLIVDE